MVKPPAAPRLTEWMTPTEAAQAFGVSRQTVNQMIRDGEFRSLHVIGPTSRPQYVVSRDEVDRLKRTRELRERKLGTGKMDTFDSRP